ncbi:MAG: hypothetical protein ACKOJF_05540, partial [Planctomycetaceae bacterium]
RPLLAVGYRGLPVQVARPTAGQSGQSGSAGRIGRSPNSSTSVCVLRRRVDLAGRFCAGTFVGAVLIGADRVGNARAFLSESD